MKRLGKALSLILCLAMLSGMTVIAASAASFTDEEEIVNIKAAGVLTDLNIMQKNDDGTFDPDGTVTRAELCRMISIALNGGKEPELGEIAYSYPDIGDHRDAAYIEYCSNLGIVAGRGDGSFDPDAAVTGTEAAKMLLVTIGYDVTNEAFVGADWAINVIVRANQKGFFDGLADDDFQGPAAPLTRDQAAQMIYNAFNAVMVEYEYRIAPTEGDELQVAAVSKDVDDGRTIFSYKFNIISE